MATTAYTIYSHYDPLQPEHEAGQIEENTDADWEAEALQARKWNRAPSPRFVRAIMDHDGSATPAASILPTNKNDVSNWYCSLTRNSGEQVEGGRNVKSTTPRLPSAPSSSLSIPRPLHINKTKEESYKDIWFIQKALLQSQPREPGNGTSPSLADILARDPPPRPSSGDKFHPPVFLALGPSNKGYALLENSGWTEGEALGVDVVRSSEKKKGICGKQEVVIRKKEVREVIDLTGSDDDEEEEEDAGEEDPDQRSEPPKSEPQDQDILQSASLSKPLNPTPLQTYASASASTRTALVTPLPTILKSDRLGIGLKAKTVGPYKASMKRVTHNSAALAAHLQRAEEARKRRDKHGRGHRAFARVYKEEQRRRAEMQAYMNS